MYCPKSLWPKIKEGLVEIHKKMKVGSPLEGQTFLSAVIDKAVSMQSIILATSQENLSLGFLTRSDTNRAVQPQKMAREAKFWIEEVRNCTIYVVKT